MPFSEEMDNNITVDLGGDEVEVFDPDVRCGYGKCKPRWLQKLNNSKLLLAVLCTFTTVQGFVLNGVNNVNTSTLERRFQLPSSRVGTISSAYDFAAAIAGVLTSFYGSRRHKARWLSLSAVSFGAGSLTMALPHFVTGLYEWGDSINNTCSYNQSQGVCKEDGLQNYLYVLILGQCLHGLGGAILYTVGVGLIDDSVPSNRSPLYLGILYGFALLGPGIGYIVGGQFLNIYVDFDRVDLASIMMTPTDPRWVGAWWLGFVLSCGLFWIIAIPLFAFGAELPSARSVRDTRISQTYKDDGKFQKGYENEAISIRALPAALCRLLRNPTYVCITFAGATEAIVTSGMATFLPKFIQNQYNLSSGYAAILTGVVVVPGAAGGNFVGGLVCRCMRLKVKGMTRFSFIGCLVTVLSFSILFLSCEQYKVAGINHYYSNSSVDELSLTSSCNAECSCKTEFYEPVCDSSGVRYFSACYAGCSSSVTSGKVFSNCSCVAVQPEQNISMVTTETCQTNCNLVYVFLPVLFIAVFFTFLPSTPTDSAIMRCIHDGDRTFGMGVKWFIIRMCGSVPGPILFGAITDATCTLWSEKCGEKTSCWLYTNDILARNYFLLIIGVKTFSFVFFLLSHLLYVAPKSDIEHVLNKQEVHKNIISNHSLVTDNGGIISEGNITHHI
ncbi:hypothetical protein CHS0354_020230 [Potamilus streckersoni]|uniref:Solute carrier organic anion transporter family member n=1 Tax=Potamilus streckersoni TaxID=2493646 RepID=A0AAE0SKL6_9BIVA|nr:hypothetical protein CHS0354_020230 [Potamilus streckersoni]